MFLKCSLSFFLLLAPVLLIFPADGVVGQVTNTQTERSISRDEEGRKYFTDLKVITHEGKEVRFYTDLLKDKRVVISFFYTNCPTAQMSQVTFFKLQKMLGEELGSEIHLLSISVDPERDDLKAIQEYAGKFNPGRGWTFLTGKKENLETINLKLGNRNPAPEAHIQVFLLGNLKTSRWIRLPETAPAFSVAEGLRTLQSEK